MASRADMSDIVLEQAGAGRISECIEVFKGSSIWEHYFSEDDRLLRSLTKAAERGELWCAVNTDGSIAGAMRVVPRGFCGLYHYLSLIGTSASARGAGVGRFMMSEFEKMAAEDGCTKVSLMVSDFNISAMDFYCSLGYWELGVIPDAAKAGISEHVMMKNLTHSGALK